MKNQALFSAKDKSKNLKCRLLQFLFGALRVKPKLSDMKMNFLVVDVRVIAILFHYDRL